MTHGVQARIEYLLERQKQYRYSFDLSGADKNVPYLGYYSPYLKVPFSPQSVVNEC